VNDKKVSTVWLDMSMSIIRRPLQYLTQAITKKIPGYDNLIGEEDEAA
jgi:hypothetical protein